MNILLVDDHPVVRVALKSWLENAFPDCKITETATVADAIAFLTEQSYDIVIIDILIRGIARFELIPEILGRRPQQKIAVVSILDERVYGMKFMRAGAKCYLPKSTGEEVFINAIRKVMNGGVFITESVWTAVLEQQISDAGPSPFDDLSYTERELIQLLLEGRSRTEISRLIGRKLSTVASYKSLVFKKLNVHSLVELSDMADMFRLGYT